MKKSLYIADWKPGSNSTEALIRELKPEDLKSDKIETFHLDAPEPNPILAPLLGLIEKNVTFAAVPEHFGAGCACYLINLTSLKED